jgi:hypothetical protein
MCVTPHSRPSTTGNAHETLAEVFAPIIDGADGTGSNQRRFSGVTGRAARPSGKSVAHGKSGRRKNVSSD